MVIVILVLVMAPARLGDGLGAQTVVVLHASSQQGVRHHANTHVEAVDVRFDLLQSCLDLHQWRGVVQARVFALEGLLQVIQLLSHFGQFGGELADGLVRTATLRLQRFQFVLDLYLIDKRRLDCNVRAIYMARVELLWRSSCRTSMYDKDMALCWLFRYFSFMRILFNSSETCLSNKKNINSEC